MLADSREIRRRRVNPSIIEGREAARLAAPIIPRISLLQTRFAFAKARLAGSTELQTVLSELGGEATALRHQLSGICAGREPKGSLADAANALDRLARLVDGELGGLA